MDNIVQTFNLSKTFLSSRPPYNLLLFHRTKLNIVALDNVNLEIKKGNIFCMLGENGAGKSTLLKILATLILPTEGSVFVNGYDIIKDELKVRASVGLLTSNERGFYWRLTGWENLDFFAALHSMSQKEIKERIDKIAQVLHIDGLLDRRFEEYSKGTKQRFAIARSLIHNPKILLLDEPTKCLDPLAIKDVWSFIKNDFLKEEKTVIFATNNILESIEADNVAFIDKGRLKIIRNVYQIKQMLKNPDLEIDNVFKYMQSQT